MRLGKDTWSRCDSAVIGFVTSDKLFPFLGPIFQTGSGGRSRTQGQLHVGAHGVLIGDSAAALGDGSGPLLREWTRLKEAQNFLRTKSEKPTSQLGPPRPSNALTWLGAEGEMRNRQGEQWAE